MKKLITICLAAAMVLAVAGRLQADWQKMDPAADVDKEFISGNPGLQPGVPTPDNSCWMATAANMLAGAGYGNGTTLQARAENIYIDMINWHASTTIANPHGVRYGGWTSAALNWWLGSANNTWGGTNPYTVVTVYGNTGFIPWANANGARFVGNELRDCQYVGLGIRWPRTWPMGDPSGGHAITAWGDDGNATDLTANPAQIIVADSDRDNGGDVQTYTYDNYANPNPGGFNEGNGWYFNFSNNHPYLTQAVTLCPTDSAVDPHDGPTQKVVGSWKIHQDQLEHATDMHYEVYTDTEILGYKTEINWPTDNEPVITESNAHHSYLDRDTIHVDWDLSDNPVPYCTWVTITTEFILPLRNYIAHEDIYFTYPGEEETKWLRPPDETTTDTGDCLGVDIRVDDQDGTTRLVADDFLCNTTGKITKVHLWDSWKYDSGMGDPPGTIRKFHLYIYSDDPVGDDPSDPNDDPDNTFSKPLAELWSGDYDQSHFSVTDYNSVQEELFWDPYLEEISYDNRIWYYEIDIPESEAFIQQGTATNSVTYWLGVSAEVTDSTDAQFGWKTTDAEHAWNDAAVMFDPNSGQWSDLYYPSNHSNYGAPVNMSFGLVTPVSVSGTIVPALSMNIDTPFLDDVNIVDIIGGYVIGAFDLWDWVWTEEKGPTLLAEYRFIHEYDYMQDPEYHTFTLQGPTGEVSSNYVATHFRFGHSYGMLDTKSLWQFNEWRTASPSRVFLSERESFELTLDWDGLLPYPPSNITPAHLIPAAP